MQKQKFFKNYRHCQSCLENKCHTYLKFISGHETYLNWLVSRLIKMHVSIQKVTGKIFTLHRPPDLVSSLTVYNE